MNDYFRMLQESLDEDGGVEMLLWLIGVVGIVGVVIGVILSETI